MIDLDLAAYFDTVRHDRLVQKVAHRVQDAEILHLLTLMLKASGKRGVPQGGVISPLLSNIYLTEVDAMLERAKAITRDGPTTYVEYARYADDLVILVNGQWRNGWLLRAVGRRLREEFAKLDLRVNEAKSRVADLTQGEAFGFLGFTFLGSARRGVGGGCRRRRASSSGRRWCGSSRRCFGAGTPACRAGRRGDQPDPAGLGELLPDWERGAVLRVRTGLGREEGAAPHDAGERPPGFGWKRWSTAWIYTALGVFNGYRVQYQVRV